VFEEEIIEEDQDGNILSVMKKNSSMKWVESRSVKRSFKTDFDFE